MQVPFEKISQKDSESQRALQKQKFRPREIGKILRYFLNLSDWNRIDLQLQQSGNSKLVLRFALLNIFTVLNTLIYMRLCGSIDPREFLSSLAFGDICYRTIQGILGIAMLSLISLLLYACATKPTSTATNSFSTIILSSYAVPSEFVLHASVGLLLADFLENSVFFIVAAGLHMIGVLFLENYLFWKDQTYYGSHIGNILLSIYTYACYLINILLPSPNAIVCCMILEIIFILVWFFLFGNGFFCSSKNRNALIIFLSLNIGSVITICDCHISSIPLSSDYIAQFIISSLACFFALFFYSNKWEFDSDSFDANSLKRFYLKLSLLFNQKVDDLEYDSFFEGIYSTHSIGCNNPDCDLGDNTLYDPTSFEQLPISDTKFNKNTRFKYMIKCLFQKLLEKQPKNVGLILNYLDFSLVQLCNPKIMDSLSKILKLSDLRLLDTLQLHKIQQCFKASIDNVTDSLCDGEMTLETIFSAEETYKEVSNNMQRYIHYYIDTWNSFERQEIDLSELRKNLQESNDLCLKIDEGWKNIQDHFKYQKRWFFIYVNYNLFLKNQKPTAKVTQFFGLNATQKSIFQSDYNYHPQSNTLRSFINQDYMFHPKSCTVHVRHEQEQLRITLASRFTPNVLGYNPSQLINLPLSVLLPLDLVNKHAQLYEEWSRKGYSVNENSYNNRFAVVRAKGDRLIPVIKFYKIRTSITAQVQYVALLKENQKQNIQMYQQDQVLQKVEDSHNEQSSIIDHASEGSANTFARMSSSLNDGVMNNEIGGRQGKLFDVSANIFIKQPELMAVEKLSEMTQIRFISRMFSFLLIASIILLFLLSHHQTNQACQHSDMFANFLAVYTTSFGLSLGIFRHVMGMDVQGKTIKTSSAKLDELVKKEQVIKSVFDKFINQPKTYYPSVNNSFNQGWSYNQIDFYLMMIDNLNTLSTLPINPNQKPFKMFQSYILPAYNNYHIAAKQKFHSSFQRQMNTIEQFQNFTIVAQLAVIVGAIIALIFRVKALFNRFKQIIQVIIAISSQNIAVIQRYWGRLYILFEGIRNRDNFDISKQNSKISFLQNNRPRQAQQQQISLNTRTKTLVYSKEMRKNYCKLMTLLGVSMIVCLASLIACEVRTSHVVQKIKDFQIAGHIHFFYYPTSTIVSLGVLEKLYSQTYQNSSKFNPQRYRQPLKLMMNNGLQNYVRAVYDESSDFFKKQKIYFYESVCDYDISISKVTMQKCKSVVEGSFTRGLAAYLRRAAQISQAYINGRTNMTAQQFQDSATGSMIFAEYAGDFIKSWETQFQKHINELLVAENTNIVLNMILLLLLHCLFFEFLVFRQLNRQYEFYYKAFNAMFPQFVLIKEKVTKQKLIQTGVIKE